MIAGKKSGTQARGRLRRKIILNSARKLLETHELDALSLGDVAEDAGVPKGSAYHFFASIADVYSELSKQIAEELREDQLQPFTHGVTSWQEVISVGVDRGVAFFNGSTAARQLLLGPKAPPEIKRADRGNDYDIGRAFQRNISQYFVLPDMPERDVLFYRAVEIADLMFCLSVLDHGIITPAMTEEAKKATCAYLSLYLPTYLPPAVRADLPVQEVMAAEQD